MVGQVLRRGSGRAGVEVLRCASMCVCFDILLDKESKAVIRVTIRHGHYSGKDSTTVMPLIEKDENLGSRV